MKKFLQDLIARKRTELKALEVRFDKSTDEAEVRALGDTMKALRDEINAAEEQLKALEDDDTTATEEEGRAATPVNAQIVRSFAAPTHEARDVAPLDTMEYRQAFADYVRTGKWEYRADETLTTAEVGKIIPNTIMNEFIKELKVYGNLYNKVRKLNVKGGVEFPIEELVPTVTWITEVTTSETKKAPKVNASISFGYHIVEARIAQSLLSSIVTLDVLESEVAKLLAEAFIKEFDRIILNGTGNGQPTGILVDTRVPKANKIAFTADELADWTAFRTKLFAKIPLAYRGGGVIVTTVATWETYFMTLKDSNNRPLYTETYDVTNGDMVCRFAGREVILVENDIIADYDSAASGAAFAVYFKPTDYAINSNMQIGFKRYFDEDKNKWVNKGLAIMDGKLLDANGVFVLTK